MSQQDETRRAYLIPVHLHKEKRISGFPIDEVLPSGVVFLICFAFGNYLTGIIIAGVWFFTLRSFKVKHGENIIQLAVYWYGSSAVNQSFFKRTPSSNRRYWIF